MVVSWARAILSISKKAWTFPARPYYYILSLPKINRKPNNSKTEGRKGYTGPLGQLWGEELPCRFLSHIVTLSPGQPRGEELPCRFLSHPGGSGGDILGPRGSPMWERAALQVPLLFHDLIKDWVCPVTPDSIDLNAAHVLLTKADLPSFPHQSAYTPHRRLFVSSERKILHFQLLYSSCCDFIRDCFLNPWVEMGANSSLRRCKSRRGQKRQKTAEKREVQQELSQDMKQLGPSSL